MRGVGDDDLTAGRRQGGEVSLQGHLKRELGVNPVDHVEHVRLDAACNLLETTQNPIAEIARVCGFGTPETMNRVFRRRLDITPGDHREHFGDPTTVSCDVSKP